MPTAALLSHSVFWPPIPPSCRHEAFTVTSRHGDRRLDGTSFHSPQPGVPSDPPPHVVGALPVAGQEDGAGRDVGVELRGGRRGEGKIRKESTQYGRYEQASEARGGEGRYGKEARGTVDI